ncbi:ANTAR domain-containing protein [Streptomyces sp. NPDC127190]|uniref:ANTAR domain-containing protein n=1 Tax=unclassified Streptomyces TaxID=2593676 RepID=UPI00362E3A98
MTGDVTVTVQPVADRAVVLHLSGTLDARGADVLGRELELRQAAGPHPLLVLDMSGVRRVTGTAVRALDTHTRHLAAGPVLVIGAAPPVHVALTRRPLPGIRLCPSLDSALAAPHGEPAENGPYLLPASPSEVFGLRAKARTSGIIGIAQGILIARYGLSGPAAAFRLLRDGSQHHNVPVRELASAVVTAPPPLTGTEWFPGRRHTPPPTGGLLAEADPRDRLQVLKAAVYMAVTLADADAVEIHLTDRVQDEALVLEAQHGLDEAYRDCLALVLGPPAVCARAQAERRPVTVADVAADPELAGHPVGRAALATGSRAVRGTPLLTADGSCSGVLSVHRAEPGVWLSPGEEAGLDVLAGELAAWRSWYRRTVVQDALEYLHTHGPSAG